MCWSIASKTSDDKTSLQALALINDCNKFKVDLSTNGVVITDAIKYVNAKMDHLNHQEKDILQDIKNKVKQDYDETMKEESEAEAEIDEEETTTANGVF